MKASPALSSLPVGPADAIVLTSPRAAELYPEAVGGLPLPLVHWALDRPPATPPTLWASTTAAYQPLPRWKILLLPYADTTAQIAPIDRTTVQVPVQSPGSGS